MVDKLSEECINCRNDYAWRCVDRRILHPKLSKSPQVVHRTLRLLQEAFLTRLQIREHVREGPLAITMMGRGGRKGAYFRGGFHCIEWQYDSVMNIRHEKPP